MAGQTSSSAEHPASSERPNPGERPGAGQRPRTDERPGAGERPMRADARRNRDRVLAAARTAFAQEGAEIQMEAIARRAGVGVGTVYRHFPTKQALVEELVRNWLAAGAATAAAALNRLDPFDALTAFVRRTTELIMRDRGLAEMYGDLDRLIDEGTEPEQVAFRTHVGALVDRAREAGVIRKEIGPAEFAALMCGLATSVQRGGDPILYADVLLQGLRPPA